MKRIRDAFGRSVVVSAFVGFLALVPAAAAAPGDLDPTFGDAGRLVSDLGYQASDMQLDDEGRLVVAIGDDVSSPPQDDEFQVARFLPSGELDATFGTGGVARVSISPARATRLNIEIDPLGRIERPS